jgi:hypothetical protein
MAMILRSAVNSTAAHLNSSEMGQLPWVDWQPASMAAHAGSNCMTVANARHVVL